MNMEQYFKKNEAKIREIYEVFRNTEHGKEANLCDWNIKNYSEFRNLPFLDSQRVNFSELFVPRDNLWCFTTSGASGHKKTIYRDIGTIVGYPKKMNETLRSNATVFLHSKRRKGESYYEAHDVNHKRMYPHGIFAEYENKDQLLKYVQKGDVVFIIEYPLMVEWICCQLGYALENKEITSGNIVKKKIYLELSGEPVTEAQVQNVIERLGSIFQCVVEYFVTYGSNEIGHMGTYIPALHGSKIIYEVIPSLFVEVAKDEIIVTPDRKHGTILFRYKTGDRGTIFFRHGKAFLTVLGKSKVDGIMYVAGAQVNIIGLASKIEKVVGGSASIECIRKDDALRGLCCLSINVHTPEILAAVTKNELSYMIKRFVTDSATLAIENHLGIVKVDVEYSTTPLKKRWFIINDPTAD